MLYRYGDIEHKYRDMDFCPYRAALAHISACSVVGCLVKSLNNHPGYFEAEMI